MARRAGLVAFGFREGVVNDHGRIDGGDPGRLFEDLALAAEKRGDMEAAAVLRDAQRIEDCPARPSAGPMGPPFAGPSRGRR